jgi:predicted nuclease with TOPRIM domain
MTAPLTVEIELKELLIELKQSIKDLDTKQDQRFNALEAKTDQRFNTLENKIENLTKTVTILSEKFDGLDKRVNKLENTQTTQLWALIALLIGAFVKFGFFPNI